MIEFQVCLYILYIYSSTSGENREKLVHLGRLFLPRRSVGYSLFLVKIVSFYPLVLTILTSTLTFSTLVNVENTRT